MDLKEILLLDKIPFQLENKKDKLDFIENFNSYNINFAVSQKLYIQILGEKLQYDCKEDFKVAQLFINHHSFPEYCLDVFNKATFFTDQMLRVIIKRFSYLSLRLLHPNAFCFYSCNGFKSKLVLKAFYQLFAKNLQDFNRPVFLQIVNSYLIKKNIRFYRTFHLCLASYKACLSSQTFSDVLKTCYFIENSSSMKKSCWCNFGQFLFILIDKLNEDNTYLIKITDESLIFDVVLACIFEQKSNIKKSTEKDDEMSETEEDSDNCKSEEDSDDCITEEDGEDSCKVCHTNEVKKIDIVLWLTKSGNLTIDSLILALIDNIRRHVIKGRHTFLYKNLETNQFESISNYNRQLEYIVSFLKNFQLHNKMLFKLEKDQIAHRNVLIIFMNRLKTQINCIKHVFNYWRHRTWCIHSKMFKKLSNKYGSSFKGRCQKFDRLTYRQYKFLYSI